MPGIPSTDRRIRATAERESWESRRRAAGKGVEYAFTSLPERTRQHILSRVLESAAAGEAVPTEATLPAVQTPGNVVVVYGQVRKSAKSRPLDDAARTYQLAAVALCQAVEAAMAAARCSQKQACGELAKRLVAGSVPAELQNAARVTYLKPRPAAGPLGGAPAQARRLERLMGFYEKGRLAGDVSLYLAPGKRPKTGHDPAHTAAFLRFYCLPSRPTVAEAFRKMVPYLEQKGSKAPCLTTVQRIARDAPVTLKCRGRVTGSEWRALKPYIERDVSMFHSNDIWVGDGHSFKAKVQHPIHGQPFVPEITVVMDWVSRKIVGWSVALAESTVAVSDAFRHAQATTRARPLVYYSDNGSGQTGKRIDCPVAGTLARQGIAHETGLPGNPQARGIIERLWQVTFIPLAREYPTCTWRGADPNAVNKMIKLLNRKDQGGVLIPSFRQFLDDVARVVADYNLHHEHRELDGGTPEDEYQARIDKNSIVFGPSDAELGTLWMPELVRVPQRGRVSLFGNSYCKAELVDMLPEGEKVRVRYDLHDASRVWLLTMDGVYLGTADWDSHREAAFPVAEIERLRAERAARKVRRGEAIIAEAQAELGEVLDMVPAEPVPGIDLVNAITADELAEMEARTPRRSALPDLLELGKAAAAEPAAPARKPMTFMEMAMWLDSKEPDTAGDADDSDAEKDSATG